MYLDQMLECAAGSTDHLLNDMNKNSDASTLMRTLSPNLHLGSSAFINTQLLACKK